MAVLRPPPHQAKERRLVPRLHDPSQPQLQADLLAPPSTRLRLERCRHIRCGAYLRKAWHRLTGRYEAADVGLGADTDGSGELVAAVGGAIGSVGAAPCGRPGVW